MYCNIDEVIRVCLILKQGKAMDPNNEDNNNNNNNSDKKKVKIAYKKVLANT